MDTDIPEMGSARRYSKRVREIFSDIAGHHVFEIQVLRVAPDHVHILLNFRRGYSVAHVIGMLKSISASEIFDKFPKLKLALHQISS